jgi:hypothetical protein
MLAAAHTGMWKRWYVVMTNHDGTLVTGESGPYASRRAAQAAEGFCDVGHRHVEYRHRSPYRPKPMPPAVPFVRG